MSTLVRSVLALAALLSAAEALQPNPYCGDLMLGEETDQVIRYTLDAAGGKVSLPDKCGRPGRKIVGMYVTACNTPNSKPKITRVGSRHHPNFHKVKIHCPHHIKGCKHLKVSVTQYCDMAGTPPQNIDS